MKYTTKARFAALGLAAALLLAGCAHAPSVSSSTVSSLPPLPSATAGSDASTAPASSAPTQEPVARPDTIDLPLNLEGMEETVPATLFSGEGYSLYLPDGEWLHTERANRTLGTPDVFTAALNDAVTLHILPSYGWTPGEAYDALLAEGYLQSDDNDHMFYQSEGGVVTCQYVTEAGDVVWYVFWSYPDTPEYLEGWGSRLPQIVATFSAQ